MTSARSGLGILVVAWMGWFGTPVQGQTASAPTVVVEISAVDPRGRAVTNLAPDDVDVRQDGVRQQVAALEAAGAAGRYELAYVPASGVAGAMTLRSVRPGVIVQSPDGGPLRPRIVPGLTPLEAELVELRTSRPDADDLRLRIAVLRFETAADGLHHTFVVEMAVDELMKGAVPPGPTLQVLLEIRGGGLRTPLRAGDVRELAVGGGHQQLVWTSQQHLPAGSYVVEMVVREAGSGRTTVRSMPLEVAEAGGGLRLSSVVLLQPFDARMLGVSSLDDPLFYEGKSVQPTLDLALPHGSEAAVRFLAIAYPDPADPAPVRAELEVLRDGLSVGTVALDPAESAPTMGPIRYSGYLPTRTFRLARYTLRVRVRQGEVVASEDAVVRIVGADPSEPPAVRLP